MERPLYIRLVASVTTDGADSTNHRMPYLGRACEFSSPMTQHVQLVLDNVSGIGYLFRSLDNIPKGPNLTIYCIMRYLVLYYIQYGRFPDEFLIQLDGGGENANNIFLAFMELLVIKRFGRKIVFTRSSVGHTHNNGDGVFGRLNQRVKNHPMETLDLWKLHVERNNEYHKLKLIVEDVYVLPDYESYIAPWIAKIGKFAKGDHTRHQFVFEAMPKVRKYPLGVRTTYMDYPTGHCVLIKPTPKDQCLTRLGQITGLEPVVHHSLPFPNASTRGQDGVEGFTILQQIPPVLRRGETFKPAPFHKDCHEKFRKMFIAIERQWNRIGNLDESARSTLSFWTDWKETKCPMDLTSEQYVQKTGFFRRILYRGS